MKNNPEQNLFYMIGAEEQPNSTDWHLRTGATYIVLRENSGRIYCQVANLYVGEITVERLMSLYFGLTGQVLNTGTYVPEMPSFIDERNRRIR